MMKNSEEWLLWDDTERNPFLNMAIDEALLLSVSRISKPLLRFYSWDTPSVTIGYVQDFSAAPHANYTVVRRITGGGVVFHDSDFTYSVILPPFHPILALPRIDSYFLFHRIVIEVLAKFDIEGVLTDNSPKRIDRAYMQCFKTPTRYDVIDKNGRKYAGAAQRRTKAGMLHQGSIALREAHIYDRQQFKKFFIHFWKTDLYSNMNDKNNHQRGENEVIMKEINFTNFFPDRELLALAEDLVRNKYSTDQWNMHKKSEWTDFT